MAERSGKKPYGQRLFKGCSCKKSQCIKNYCDCYQSMVICTIYCKCIGCRNTEPRIVTTPVKGELKNIHHLREHQRKSQALQYNPVNAAVISYDMQNAVLTQPVQLQQNLFQQSEEIIFQDQPPQTAIMYQQQQVESFIYQEQQQQLPESIIYQEQQQTVQLMKQLKKEEQPTNNSENPIKKETSFMNVLTPEVCDSALANLLAQEEETQQVGLNDLERRQVMLNEMERCMSMIFLAQKRERL